MDKNTVRSEPIMVKDPLMYKRSSSIQPMYRKDLKSSRNLLTTFVVQKVQENLWDLPDLRVMSIEERAQIIDSYPVIANWRLGYKY